MAGSLAVPGGGGLIRTGLTFFLAQKRLKQEEEQFQSTRERLLAQEENRSREARERQALMELQFFGPIAERRFTGQLGSNPQVSAMLQGPFDVLAGQEGAFQGTFGDAPFAPFTPGEEAGRLIDEARLGQLEDMDPKELGFLANAANLQSVGFGGQTPSEIGLRQERAEVLNQILAEFKKNPAILGDFVKKGSGALLGIEIPVSVTTSRGTFNFDSGAEANLAIGFGTLFDRQARTGLAFDEFDFSKDTFFIQGLQATSEIAGQPISPLQSKAVLNIFQNDPQLTEAILADPNNPNHIPMQSLVNGVQIAQGAWEGLLDQIESIDPAARIQIERGMDLIEELAERRLPSDQLIPLAESIIGDITEVFEAHDIKGATPIIKSKSLLNLRFREQFGIRGIGRPRLDTSTPSALGGSLGELLKDFLSGSTVDRRVAGEQEILRAGRAEAAQAVAAGMSLTEAQARWNLGPLDLSAVRRASTELKKRARLQRRVGSQTETIRRSTNP